MSDIPSLREIAGTTCLVNKPAQPIARLILAHGAGAAMDSPFMTEIAQMLADRDVEVVRFEFPYMVRRRQTGIKSPPDRQPVLLDVWRQVVEALKAEDELPLFIGGKSMGGRMATLVGDEAQVKGVVCLGYPFYPVGKPEKPRTDHLRTLATPTLIVQGTRDSMGNRERVIGYDLSRVINLIWLETGNHDLKPLRSSGWTAEEALEHTAGVVAGFMSRLV